MDCCMVQIVRQGMKNREHLWFNAYLLQFWLDVDILIYIAAEYERKSWKPWLL